MYSWFCLKTYSRYLESALGPVLLTRFHSFWRHSIPFDVIQNGLWSVALGKKTWVVKPITTTNCLKRNAIKRNGIMLVRQAPREYLYGVFSTNKFLHKITTIPLTPAGFNHAPKSDPDKLI